MDTILKLYRKAYAHRKPIFLVGKILIAILLIFAIYQHLFAKGDFEEMKTLFLSKLQNSNPLYLIFAILLMPFNWYFESLRFSILLSPFQKLDARKSLYSVLTGVCLGIITPGRLGEYGGRLFYVKDENRLLAIRATFLGSIVQNVIITVVGLVCLLLLQRNLMIITSSDMNMIGFILLVGVLGLLFLYLIRRPILAYVYSKFPNLRSKIKSLFDISKYSSSHVAKVWLYTLIRFLIYMTQYLLVIQFFEVSDDIYFSILGVGAIYLFQVLLPLPPMISIFARGEIAVVIWSYFSNSVLGILAATFSLWFINLLIPALVGYYFLTQLRLK